MKISSTTITFIKDPHDGTLQCWTSNLRFGKKTQTCYFCQDSPKMVYYAIKQTQ